MRTAKFKTLFMAGMFLCLAGAGWGQGKPEPKQQRTDSQQADNIRSSTIVVGPQESQSGEAAAHILFSKFKTPDDVVAEYVPQLGKDSQTKNKALIYIESELLKFRNQEQKVLNNKSREDLMHALITEYTKATGRDKETEKTKELIAELLAQHGSTSEAHQFVFKIIETEPENIRNQALAWLGSADGVSGDDAYDKVNEWVKKGIVNKNRCPSLLLRLNKKRAMPEILHLADTTMDREEFFYTALALQDSGAVGEMSRVYRRVRELKMDTKYKDYPDGLYWIDGKKMEAYLKQATGDDLIAVLDVISVTPSVVTHPMIDMFIDKLNDSDSQIRLRVIKRLERASENPRFDSLKIEKAFESALNTETNQKIKEALSTSLRQVKRNEKRAIEFKKREAEWINGAHK